MSVSPPDPSRARIVSSILIAIAYVTVFVPLIVADDSGRVWLGLLVVAVQVACLLGRWRWPRVALVISLIVASIGLVTSWCPDPCIASACVLYAATIDAPAPSRQALWTAWVMLAGAIGAFLLVGFGVLGHDWRPTRDTIALLLAPSILAASWVLACTLAARRDR